MNNIAAVEPLIKELNVKDTDLQKQVAESLKMITKHHFLFRNGNHALWASWWDKNKSSFK
jgi:hypothetical protein